jgi:shikimate dehydrogenase
VTAEARGELPGRPSGRVMLLGYPLAHSLSPRFQNAAFRALGLALEYHAHPTPSFDAPALSALLRDPGCVGCNVTVPYKELASTSLVDDRTEVARAAGAVNTVFKRGDRLVGDNTDVGGFLCHLRSLRDGALPDRAVLLGAGGAARAILVGLADAGVAVAVINRSAERAHALVRELGRGRVSSTPSEDVARAALIVDSTALGLGAHDEPAREAARRDLAALLPEEHLGPDVLLYDLKYGAGTPLAQVAARRGLAFSDGLGMLVMQGALAFERWTGRPAPVEVMCEAVGLSAVPDRRYAPAG